MIIEITDNVKQYNSIKAKPMRESIPIKKIKIRLKVFVDMTPANAPIPVIINITFFINTNN
jgi:hypothetical protein